MDVIEPQDSSDDLDLDIPAGQISSGPSLVFQGGDPRSKPITGSRSSTPDHQVLIENEKLRASYKKKEGDMDWKGDKKVHGRGDSGAFGTKISDINKQ